MKKRIYPKPMEIGILQPQFDELIFFLPWVLAFDHLGGVLF